MHNSVAYFFDINDMSKTIAGFEKGSCDGVRGGRIESKMDDMLKGMTRYGGVPAWCVQAQGW